MSLRSLGAEWLQLSEGGLDRRPLHQTAGGGGGLPQDSPALPAALEADGDLPRAPLTPRVVPTRPDFLGHRRGIGIVRGPKLKTWDRAPPEGLSWVWSPGRIPSGTPFPGPGAVARRPGSPQQGRPHTPRALGKTDPVRGPGLSSRGRVWLSPLLPGDCAPQTPVPLGVGAEHPAGREGSAGAALQCVSPPRATSCLEPGDPDSSQEGSCP